MMGREIWRSTIHGRYHSITMHRKSRHANSSRHDHAGAHLPSLPVICLLGGALKSVFAYTTSTSASCMGENSKWPDDNDKQVSKGSRGKKKRWKGQKACPNNRREEEKEKEKRKKKKRKRENESYRAVSDPHLGAVQDLHKDGGETRF